MNKAAFPALAKFSPLQANACLNGCAELFWPVWCGQKRGLPMMETHSELWLYVFEKMSGISIFLLSLTECITLMQEENYVIR